MERRIPTENTDDDRPYGFWVSLKRGFTGEDMNPATVRGRRAGSWVRIVAGSTILFYAYWLASGWLRVEPIVRQLFGTWIVVGAATLIAYLSFAKYQGRLDHTRRALDETRGFGLRMQKAFLLLAHAEGILRLTQDLETYIWVCLPDDPLAGLLESNYSGRVSTREYFQDALALTVGLQLAREAWSKIVVPIVDRADVTEEEKARYDEMKEAVEEQREKLLILIENVRGHLEKWLPEVNKSEQSYIDSLREEGLLD